MWRLFWKRIDGCPSWRLTFVRHPFHFWTFIGEPVRRHAAIHRRQRFAGGGVADFVGNLDVGNPVAAPHGDVKCPHGVARDFLADGIAAAAQ